MLQRARGTPRRASLRVGRGRSRRHSATTRRCWRRWPDRQRCALSSRGGATATGSHRAALAAVEGGATWLGVALVSEAVTVREQLERTRARSSPSRPVSQLDDVARLDGVRPTLYRAEAVRAAAKEVRDAGRTYAAPRAPEGRHRHASSGRDARRRHRPRPLIDASEELELEGVWTHLAAAEDPRARRLHRAPARSVRERARALGRSRHRAADRARRQLRRPARAPRTLVTTSSVAASRCTASRHARACPKPTVCVPRWRSRRVSRS